MFIINVFWYRRLSIHPHLKRLDVLFSLIETDIALWVILQPLFVIVNSVVHSSIFGVFDGLLDY